MTLYRIQSEKCSLEIGEIWKVMASYKNNNNNSDETLPFYHSHSSFVIKNSNFHPYVMDTEQCQTHWKENCSLFCAALCYGIFGHGSAVNQLKGLPSTASIKEKTGNISYSSYNNLKGTIGKKHLLSSLYLLNLCTVYIDLYILDILYR